jgi:Resolvase, N terminal domain
MANIGYARCSTLAQDLTAQRQALAALGVPRDRIYIEKGLTGTSRARPGLDQARWPPSARATRSPSPSWTASPAASRTRWISSATCPSGG